MARQISQETFDEAVRENIEEFSMTEEEAISDAIKQFESQGVNLKNVITNTETRDIAGELGEKIDTIRKLTDTDHEPRLIDLLNEFKSILKMDPAIRVLAGSLGAYDALIHPLVNDNISTDLKILLLETLTILMTGYPDLLDETGINLILKLLDDNSDMNVIEQVLNWTVQCCIKHEVNRKIFLNDDDARILKSLYRILTDEKCSPNVVSSMCRLFQTFVLDDDIRTQVSSSHQNACYIAKHFLRELVVQLTKYKDNDVIVIAILKSLISVNVRNEFCQEFYEVNGLHVIYELLSMPNPDENVCTYCFNLLKIVSGNDEVKSKVLQIISPEILIATMQKYLNSTKVCTQTLSALSSFCLRNSGNSKLLCENEEVAEIVVRSMKTHSGNRTMMKSACWLIRNMLQHGNRDYAAKFLTYDVEEVLRKMLLKYDDCSFEAKTALRLLGCPVELKEEWTGEGKGITN